MEAIEEPRPSGVFDRLTALSREDHYNPYQEFTWPDTLPADSWWMSPELLSLYGTSMWEQMSLEEQIRLSHWESVNFYGLNVHGIRELMREVLSCIYTAGFEKSSEYFHHFLGEENGHMWFFAQFCQRYGQKIYDSKTFRTLEITEPRLRQFVAFSQILIFEMMGDFFNVRMQNDSRLPAIVQQINRFHHHDESRHITMGRQIVAQLYAGISQDHAESEVRELERYLRGYLWTCVTSLYNVSAYRDAGIQNSYEVRRAMLVEPARLSFHLQMTAPVHRVFQSLGLFQPGRDAV